MGREYNKKGAMFSLMVNPGQHCVQQRGDHVCLPTASPAALLKGKESDQSWTGISWASSVSG